MRLPVWLCQERERFLAQQPLGRHLRFEIEYANHKSQRVEGIYTVDEQRMKSLSAEALVELHSLQYLALIYTMIASLGHVYSLINRKNVLLAG